MITWQPYTETVTQHSVVGDLRVARAVYSPQLDNTRDIFVWLPPTYTHDSTRRYPVIYMHDAQNLFDRYTSYVGEWGVDETLTALSAEGIDAIIVGLPNSGVTRVIEYSPYPSMLAADYNGKGDSYLQFITDTIKPLIDSTYRTHPDAAHTGIAGSSMGGLISLYGMLTRPETFGFCGAFSVAYWFGHEAIYETVRTRTQGHGRIYLDVGGQEGLIFNDTVTRWGKFIPNGAEGNRLYVESAQKLRDLLISGGYTLGESLLYVEDPDGLHHEATWAAHLPQAFRFLLHPTR
jgi:predicted alpha/beta superfamily hydrolase